MESSRARRIIRARGSALVGNAPDHERNLRRLTGDEAPDLSLGDPEIAPYFDDRCRLIELIVECRQGRAIAVDDDLAHPSGRSFCNDERVLVDYAHPIGLVQRRGNLDDLNGASRAVGLDRNSKKSISTNRIYEQAVVAI